MPSGSHFLEDEAERDSDSDEKLSDSSEEESEDDEKLQAENEDGFIVNENDLDEEDEDEEQEEEEEEARPSSSRRKRRRRKRSQLELDDEDLHLVEENTGKKIKRNKRVFKRQEETTAPVGRDGLAREFGVGDDYQGLEDFDDDLLMDTRGNQMWRDAPEGSYDEEAGEMDDFIEHDGETNIEQYRAHRRALAKTARAQGISVEAAQEFLEIFGQDKDTDDMLQMWYSGNEIDRPVDGLAPELQEEEEGAAVDPVLVEQYHLSEVDDEVRQANCPERLYVEMDKIPPFNAKDAAKYIYQTLLGPHSPNSLAKWIVSDGCLEVEGVEGESVDVMMRKYFGMVPGALQETEYDGVVKDVSKFRFVRQPRVPKPNPEYEQDGPAWSYISEWEQDNEAQDLIEGYIRNAIKMMFIEHFEVPVLAMFFKEQMGDLLCLRSGDSLEGSDICQDERAFNINQDHKKLVVLPGAVMADTRRIRQWDVLWAIYDKAFAYFELVKQRTNKISQLDVYQRQGDLEPEPYEVYKEQFESAMTVEELNECFSYFKMLVEPAVDDSVADQTEAGKDRKYRQMRPRKASRFHNLIRSGLHTLASELVMDTETFSKSINTLSLDETLGYVETIEDMRLPEPSEEADIYICARAPGTEKTSAKPAEIEQALANAAYILVQEIATHPTIRAKVRELVRGTATVSTEPTEIGAQMLSPFHKYGAVKRVRQKPVRTMLQCKDQFLLMAAAEKEGLIKLTLEIPQKLRHDHFDFPFINIYTVGVDPEVAPSLHAFRSQVIEKALNDHLIPMGLAAAREEMLQESEKFVLDQYIDKLWVEISTPPLQLRGSYDEEPAAGDHMEIVRGQRICIVTWGDNSGYKLDNATRMVMLDSRGYPSDVLSLPQLSGHIPASPANMSSLAQDDRKADDAKSIITFLEKHWPHLIVVGTTSMACAQLHADICKICEDEFPQDKRNENLSPLTNFVVRLVNDNVASIYESSRFAAADLKEHPRLVRRATALGRACIEPMAVLCALMHRRDEPELLALQMHPLQGMVAKEKRVRAAEQLLMSAIAQEGVCVNDCVQKDWLSPMLQFVPGLGPRKAAYLIKQVKSLPENDELFAVTIPGQTLISRDHLLCAENAADEDTYLDDHDDHWKAVRILHKKVFANAAPFLRVTDPNEVHESNDEIFSVKDNMRVHPRDENALTAISCAATGVDSMSSDDPIPGAIQNHDQVLQFDVSQFDRARQEEDPSRGSRLATLLDLSFELQNPYGSVRAPERLPLTEEDTFWALTGENPASLKPGKLITARVVWIQQHYAGLVTDNGVLCHLDRKDANTIPRESLEHSLRKGMEVTARVLDIDYRTMRLKLSSKSEELANNDRWEHEYLAFHDPFYHVLTDAERNEIERARRDKQKRKVFQQRPINHMRFINLAAKDVKKALIQPAWNNIDKLRRYNNPAGAQDGDAVFHPSPKGPDRLLLSVRLFTRENRAPVIQQIDVLETKSQKVGNHLMLGTPLRIQQFPFLDREDTQFEDLDDLLVNFVKPYCEKFREVQKFKKFFPGSMIGVDHYLTEQFGGQAEYRLCLKWDGEDSDKQVHHELGTGWGIIAVKVDERNKPMHFPFKICHKGYYYAFTRGTSELASNVHQLVAKMKQYLQDRPRRDKQDAQSRMQSQPTPYEQQYGGYYMQGSGQVPPQGGHYGANMAGHGYGNHARLVPNHMQTY